MTKIIKNKIIVANIETGELNELKPLLSSKNNLIYIEKSQKFIKIFDSFISALHTFNKNELIILQYVFKNLKPNNLNIIIHPTATKQSKTTFITSINKLYKKNILNKTENKYQFIINPNMFINGKYYNCK